MKNKIIPILLVISMVVVYMPTYAFADNLDVEETQINDEENVNELNIQEDSGDIVEDQVNIDLQDTDIDFSSKRLIVKGLKQELKDEPVIASLDGVYLLQYDTEEEAKLAYSKLSQISDSVEVDSFMSIAETNDNNETEVSVMTEEENPFTEVDEVNVTPERYNIAVIDTGAITADKIISVLNDDGQDYNGHGQKMIDNIKTYAPEAKILSIKAIGDDGYGDVSAVYAAIRLAIDEKVDIINLSISALSTEDNFIIEEIIAEAQNQGIIVVGAAGNNGIDASLTVPGKVVDATIVGTTNSISNTGETVDYYINTSSTSIATAIVSGLIASNTLQDYEIEDKVIKLDLDNEEDNNILNELSEEFSTQGSATIDDINDVRSVAWKVGSKYTAKAWRGQNYLRVPNDSPLTLRVRQLTKVNGNNVDKINSADNGVTFKGYLYCVNPGVEAPDPGSNYTVDNRVDASDTNASRQKLRKAVYYAKGFPGYNKKTKAWYKQYTDARENDGTSPTSAWVLWHCILTHAARKAKNLGDVDGTDAMTYSGNSGKKDITWLNRWWDALDDLPAPPDDFSIFFVEVAGKQDLVGGVTIKIDEVSLGVIKKSSLTIPDENIDNYSLKGAIYYLYDTQAQAQDAIDAVARGDTPPNTGRVKDTDGDYIRLKTDEDGITNTEEVVFDSGDKTFWAAEIKAPTSGAYELDPTPRKIVANKTNDEDDPATTTSKDGPVKPKVKIHKKITSSASAITANNPSYKVEGTKFALYNTQADAKAGTNAVATFTVDANGNSSEVKVFMGDYYLVETSIGRGLLIPNELKASSGGYKITVKNETRTVDIP